ncbi:MAG: DUF6798 domain-containing protein [Saprospiraceae bacterium]
MVYIGAVEITRKYFEQGWPYVAVYMLLLLEHGYLFGSNDQMDFMPYARHLQDPSLYASDFYINCISQQFNERWLLGHLMALIPHGVWPGFFLSVHFGCTVLLMAGMKKWAAHFVSSSAAQWTAILITLIVLYHRNLGGNELYYNMLTASNLAKAFAIWALWYAFKGKTGPSSVLIALCTYFHPIVGAQVFTLSMILSPPGQNIRLAFISLALILPYLLSLFIHLDESISASLFSDIMFVRNAHHFFPASFGLINYILLAPFFLFGTYRFWIIDKRMAMMLTVIMVGCLFYSLGILMMPKYVIMTQWFKTTIWLKFFCVVATINWIKGLPNGSIMSYSIKPHFILFGLIILFCVTKVIKNYWTDSPLYQLPWSQRSEDEKTAQNAKILSNQNEVFLVPPDFTAFKYYAERSTYVDWKALPHNGVCLGDWWQRISKVYGISLDDRGGLNSIYLKANDHLFRLTSEDKAEFKSRGITFIVFKSGQSGPYSIEKL